MVNIDILKEKIPQEKLKLIEKKLNITNEEFTIRLDNFLKAMYIYSLHGRGFCPFVGEIDELWHEFILQTEFYKWFCVELMPGKTFMHHESIELDEWEKENGLTQEENIKSNMIYIGYYFKYFGCLKEEQIKYWSAPNFLYFIVGLSLEEINDYAEEISREISYKKDLIDNSRDPIRA